ncbi:MAG TPA: hypothetical protein VMV49_18455 [Candidatus Deferrimicrobium sp.]|nr:hypothetical protein [Candidatus Deferrimicrobium sp.]
MFTTRDIRGVFGKDITPDKLKALSMVLSHIATQITIGMDYRKQNEKILEGVLSNFQGSVRYLDRISSPAVAYLAEQLGVCITASHNPPVYNGIKFFKPKRILYADEVENLRNQYLEMLEKKEPLQNSRKIRLEIDEDLVQQYITAIPEIQDGIYDLCGGAACRFNSRFPETIFNKPDPTFQFHAPEPKENTLDHLKEATKKKTKVGYAFDGDADRIVLVVNGKLIPGDILIAYTAEHYLKENDKVILSLDCSQEVFDYIRDVGCNPIYAAVGQNLLIVEAIKTKAAFIGEFSGHYSFVEFMYYSDPLYFVGKISDTKPADLQTFLPQFQNIILREKIEGKIDYALLKQALEKWTDQFVLLDGIKAILKDDNAAILIRHSQSEPITRINVESKNLKEATRIFGDLKEVIKNIIK